MRSRGVWVPAFAGTTRRFCRSKNTRQYLSNGLICVRKRKSQGAKRGRAERPRRRVEGAECAVDSAVFVSDLHRGRLGANEPAVPDSAVPDPGARRCRGGAAAGLARADPAGLAHDLRDDMRLPAVGGVRHSRRDADRGIEDRGKLRLSAAGVLAIGAEDRDRALVCGVVRLRYHPQSDFSVPVGILSGGGLGGAGVQIGRPRHGRPGARDAGEPLPCVLRRQPPHAMPAIFSGLKVSVTLAVVGAVVGEFVGSNSGIGYVLQRSIGTFDLPTMFAALVILALLGVVLFWIVDRIERFVIPWHVSQREDIIFAS